MIGAKQSAACGVEMAQAGKPPAPADADAHQDDHGGDANAPRDGIEVHFLIKV